MNNKPENNTAHQSPQGAGAQDTDINKDTFHKTDNSGSDNLNDERPQTGDDRTPENAGKQHTDAGNGHPEDDTDKYLAMEQPGVTYTQDTPPVITSDDASFDENNKEGLWNEEGGNPRYSDAFNQDEYILDDNLDLDEDQNQSISSDDDDFEETNERYTN